MTRAKLGCLIMTAVLGVCVFISYFSLGDRGYALLYNEVLSNNLVSTGVTNIVMTVYLNYRLFDTIFEAMLLLICVMGVLQFSQLSKQENNYIEQVRTEGMSEKFSPLMIDSLKNVYPFVFVFGLYIIISGLVTPGGGFQGGAIIAAIIMSLHLSTGRSLITVDKAIVLEKIMFIMMLLISIAFLIWGSQVEAHIYRLYLAAINIIIGVKVFSGFVILYLQFMHSGRGLEKVEVKQ